jgi:predicted dehydrogenase
MYKVAVVGYGYWGPNLVRNFENHAQCEVVYICDMDNQALARAKSQYKNIEIINDLSIILEDSGVDIIAISTPVRTHYEIAEKSLKAGKHIFVEKPMVETLEQSRELIKLAKDKQLIGVVDHTFLFTGAVQKIKEIVDSGEIGEIIYFDSVRVNLGLFQHDVDVIWDLAPHDLSILFHLLDDKPTSVMASGVDHFGNNLVDVAYLTLNFRENMIANFHMNWLSPVKVRKILIGGTKKMIVFDDMEPSEKIKIYDKGVTVNSPEDIHSSLVSYRLGDMYAPNISQTEALGLEVKSFIDQINSNNELSINSLLHGESIIKVLEATKISLAEKKLVML